MTVNIDPESPLELAVTSLMEAAAVATGLDDWGPDRSFVAGLQAVVDAMAGVDHHPAVVEGFRNHMVGLLSTRLHLVDDQQHHPDILEGRVERPVILIGLARTGTTILHDLLALDPDARAPREWETAAPWPAPETASWDTDPRIAAVDAQLENLLQAAPQLRAMHPWGARLPSDCLNMMALHFASAAFWAAYSIDDFARWLVTDPVEGLYRTHRRILQQLQWKGPQGRWTLKEPTHQLRLQALVAAYPDACLVQTHRDPGRTIPSAADLVHTIQAISKPDQDPVATGAMAMDLFGACIDVSTAARSAGPALDDRILDVAYADTVTDPVGQVRRIHEHFDLPFSAEHAQRIENHLAQESQAKHGKHTYTAAQYGLDDHALAAAFPAYRNRFGHLLAEPDRSHT